MRSQELRFQSFGGIIFLFITVEVIEMLPIEIPIVENNLRLDAAVDLMQREHCYAVLVPRPSGPVVLDQDVVLNAMRHMGNRAIGTVRPRMASIDISAQFPSQVDIMTNSVNMQEIEDLLDRRRAAFAYVGPVPDNSSLASVLTRYEALDYVRRPGRPLWRCRLDRTHVWRQDQLLQGNRCPRDNATTKKI